MNTLFSFIILLFIVLTSLSHGETKMSKDDLKKKLTTLQFQVTQENGTEKAFDNEYWNNKEDGIYVDVTSGEPLFSSLDKYDSGSGWPSFTKPIDKKLIANKSDNKYGMSRIEVRSANSDSHLGHVFNDGPGPDGQRFCINSAALKFIPKAQLKEKGYGEYMKLFEKEESVATFGGGCFWGVQSILSDLDGVIETSVGYMGGTTPNPTYKIVSTGTSGHAEVVNIKFDPKKITYEKLLEYFFRLHDPTTINRQGPDVGTQYRSVIFFHSESQRADAQKYIELFNKKKIFKTPAVTQVVPAQQYYLAEEYHQDYFKKAGGVVCHRLRDQ